MIGLLADPHLPATLADQLRDDLPDLLRGAVSDAITWTVHTIHDPFEELYPDHSQLIAKAREHTRGTQWDLVICVTDLPMQDASGVTLGSIDAEHRLAVLSLPALGGLFLRHRLRAVVLSIIASMAAHTGDSRQRTTGTELRQRLRLRSTRVRDPEPGSAHLHIVRVGWSSRLHLLAGMVRANRPGQLLLGISTAMAGALAGIAFGVIYSSIWSLGTAIGAPRLAGLVVAALAAMTLWTIVSHGLWERRRQTEDGRNIHRRLRNASTVLTVAVGTIAFFLAMFAVALAAVALVIPPGYLAGTLNHPVDVADYLAIALMATVLGTLAGAVGSGLEDGTVIRQATYSYREQERRHRAELVTEDRTTHT